MLQFERYTKSQQKEVQNFLMNKGDVFLSGGKHFAYERTLKGNRNVLATCLEDGKAYKTTNRNKFNIIGKYEFPVQDVASDDRVSLRPGDLFLITDDNTKTKGVFRYNRANEKTVVGINPLTGGEVKISNGFTFIKLENLKF